MNDGKLLLLINTYHRDYKDDERIHPDIWELVKCLQDRVASRKPLWIDEDERHDAHLILNYLVTNTRQTQIKRPAPYDFARHYTGKTALGSVEFIEHLKTIKYVEGNKHGKNVRG